MRNIQHLFTKQLLGAAIASAALIVPAIASAQDAPMYAMTGSDQQIQGRILAINGTWNLTVADASGYTDSIELHQGTVINPLGLTLAPGMRVTIDGYPDGQNFDAMEIDTPYQYQGPPPVAVYYGPGSWAPGYAYGWGPSFSLTFDIGSNRFEQRSFVYGGAARYPMAPPSGWQDRPHGYIGAAAPQSRNYTAPQQSHGYAAPPQQSHAYAAPPHNPPPAIAHVRGTAAAIARLRCTAATVARLHGTSAAQSRRTGRADDEPPAGQRPLVRHLELRAAELRLLKRAPRVALCRVLDDTSFDEIPPQQILEPG